MKIYSNIKNILFIAVVLITSVISSCTSEDLEVKPVDRLTEDIVFRNEQSADNFLSNIYSSLPDCQNAWVDNMENWSDNTIAGEAWILSRVNYLSTYDASTKIYEHGYNSTFFRFSDIYHRIRKANLFLEKIEELDDEVFSAKWKKVRTAEARFLRAYFYHNGWMAYGGLPLVTKKLDVNTMEDSEIFVPRSTSEQTLNFITDEFQAASDDLPVTSEVGRITKGAALAYKGWCFLYAGKFAQAEQAYKGVIDLGAYELAPNWEDIWDPNKQGNSEQIFIRPAIPSQTQFREIWMGIGGALGLQGWNFQLPTQNLVDAFWGADGLPIRDDVIFNYNGPVSTVFDANKPYENRDPRFYMTVIYDGSTFANQTILVGPGDAFSAGDADRPTGYWYKKLLIEDSFLPGSPLWQHAGIPYNYMRYGDVLLSYAEALMEQNKINDDCLDAINQVRTRVGIPSLQEAYGKLTFSQEELRPILRNERRIELCLEDKRWWDIRRWREAEYYLNIPEKGVRVSGDPGNRTYTYVDIQERKFYPRNYLFPLPQSTLDRNEVIRSQNGGPDNWNNGQNPGY